MEELQIRLQNTPNPDAMKYILSRDVKREGKATFDDPLKCFDNVMATDLLLIPGVSQIHFFENVVTVTKNYGEWEDIDAKIRSVLMTRMPAHNPDFRTEEDLSVKRANLSPELLKIEEILDRTIRPGLQGDGGDLEVVRLEGKNLFIRYQGACGTCPSSMTGTLYAIEDILKNEFDSEISISLA